MNTQKISNLYKQVNTILVDSINEPNTEETRCAIKQRILNILEEKMYCGDISAAFKEDLLDFILKVIHIYIRIQRISSNG